jgi:hypothetical protein
MSYRDVGGCICALPCHSHESNSDEKVSLLETAKVVKLSLFIARAEAHGVIALAGGISGITGLVCQRRVLAY